MLSFSRGLPLFRGRGQAAAEGVRVRPLARSERSLVASIVETAPAQGVHVGAALWTVESLLGTRPRFLWAVEERGHVVGAVQNYRGVSWAVRSHTARDGGFIRAIAEFLARSVSSTEVVFGPERQVDAVLERARPRGLYPAEIRRQEMLAMPGYFAPQLPGTDGEFVLRHAVESDLPWLLETHTSMCLEDVGVDQVAKNPAAYGRYFRELLAEQRAFVGEVNGQRVFKAETPLESCGARLIEGVYSDPRMRGRGFASRAVMSLAIGAARDGMRACLYVHRRNERALGVYRRLGFRSVCGWTTAVIAGDGSAPEHPAIV